MSGGRIASLQETHMGQWRINSALLHEFDFQIVGFFMFYLICSGFTSMDFLASLAPQKSPQRTAYTVAKSQAPNMQTHQTQNKTEACAAYDPLFAKYRNKGEVVSNFQAKISKW